MNQDFDIGGRKFKLGKIDAFKQFHIVRRVGPILADMLPALKDIAKAAKGGPDESEEMKLDQISKFVGPIMEGLSRLSDADADKVLFGLLSAVEVQHGGGSWAKVSNGTMLMMQDLELPVLLQLAGRAFMFNLSGFFAALPKQ